MVRVLHVVLGLEIGGLEAFVLDLSKAYNANVSSTIVCLRGHGKIMAKDTGHANIVYLDGPENFSWHLISRLRQLIHSESIDIVHTHNPGPHLYGALAGRLCRKPVIHTKHGRNYPENRRKVLLNRIATMLTHRIIAVSRDAEAVCREIESVPKAKLKTILNGTNLNEFTPKAQSGDLKASLGIPSDVPLVGIVARLSRVKNHKLLFRSMQELASLGVNAALAVVGDGPLEQDLRQDVQELGLGDTVHFLGARSDVGDLYPEFDVFVLSSLSEGVSLTLLEAMSCEIPVVATRVGGNPEVVEHGVTGYIVAESDQAIAKALASLLTGEGANDKRIAMGKQGRERVAAVFSMETTADTYLAEYLELLGKRGERNET